MSLPRPICPGALYMSTRRTAHRQLLLRPSRETNEAIAYVIAFVAARTGIAVHALVAMSNHLHVVATDTEGRMPEFLRDVHALIAKCINSSMGRWENLWSSQQTSLVRAVTDDDVLGRIVYTMVNPVSAHLVERGHQWPGLRCAWPAKPAPVRRPAFFRKDGSMPKSATLVLARPPGHATLSDAAFAAVIREAIVRREKEIVAAARREGKTFLGARAVCAQDRYASPSSPDVRRQLSPRIAAYDKWRRIEALQRLRDWLEQYCRAFQSWRAGFRKAEFPAGTYQLRVQAGVRCAPG